MRLMAVQFYDVKAKAKVEVPESKVKKTKYERTTKSGSKQVRYALRGETADGRKLTKFVNQQTWDSMNVPME